MSEYKCISDVELFNVRRESLGISFYKGKIYKSIYEKSNDDVVFISERGSQHTMSRNFLYKHFIDYNISGLSFSVNVK